MNEAIKLAVEKGGYPHYSHTEEPLMYDAKCMLVLDPLFWQALGKALGNKDEMRCDSPKCDDKLCAYAGYKDPKEMFNRYMETLWYGGDTEKFWSDLLTSKL
jgi:hypothetical protein